MILQDVLKTIINPALEILHARMSSPEAKAMLLAIGLQESGFRKRLQVGGPARGFWQFEFGGGIAGVMTHKRTKVLAHGTLARLQYQTTPEAAYRAVAENDVLACVFARLLLFTLPHALPGPVEVERGWSQYIEGWRPGRPHPEKWADYYHKAWEAVQDENL